MSMSSADAQCRERFEQRRRLLNRMGRAIQGRKFVAMAGIDQHGLLAAAGQHAMDADRNAILLVGGVTPCQTVLGMMPYITPASSQNRPPPTVSNCHGPKLSMSFPGRRW